MVSLEDSSSQNSCRTRRRTLFHSTLDDRRRRVRESIAHYTQRPYLRSICIPATNHMSNVKSEQVEPTRPIDFSSDQPSLHSLLRKGVDHSAARSALSSASDHSPLLPCACAACSNASHGQSMRQIQCANTTQGIISAALAYIGENCCNDAENDDHEDDLNPSN